MENLNMDRRIIQERKGLNATSKVMANQTVHVMRAYRKDERPLLNEDY
jgi:hypothetical protein